MTKLLNGRDLAGFIKVRQAQQVRALHQKDGTLPLLKIFVNRRDPVIETYVRLKQTYGDDIGVEVDIDNIYDADKLKDAIKAANQNKAVHGIIVQLPLDSATDTDAVLSLIDSGKDVDGLSGLGKFDSATAEAINWLLTGYNIGLKNKDIAIVGAGRLVGAPLYKMWKNSGLNPELFDKNTENIPDKLKEKDIIVSGVGKPGLITSEMLKKGAVIVDAGTTSEGGAIYGDVADDVYQRDDITITPKKGGVGPLTVAALFDHVIVSASVSKK